METYSLQQMNVDTIQFISNPIITNDPYYIFYYLQYLYALRFSEIQNSASWDRTDSQHITIPLMKGQDFRIIYSSEQEIDLIMNLISDQSFITHANNTTASNLFNRLYPKKIYLDSGKSLTTHFFRHYRIKFLHQTQLQTYENIALWIGEKSILNVIGYDQSVILY
jgi:hypothetical protein